MPDLSSEKEEAKACVCALGEAGTCGTAQSTCTASLGSSFVPVEMWNLEFCLSFSWEHGYVVDVVDAGRRLSSVPHSG